MPRKNQYQWSIDGQEQEERKSRSQKKRESSALQSLGEELMCIPLKELEKLPLKPDLLSAFAELKHITSREARRRHIQYIGRLMREEEDIPALEKAVELFKQGLPISRFFSK